MSSHSVTPEDLLTPGQVAALLHVDPRTVTRWAAAGRLRAVRTPGGHRRYFRSEVLAIASGPRPDPHESTSRSAAAAVVAEAVALALEAVAAEASEQVLLKAAAVTAAALRAAETAEAARGARAFAAQTAVLSVAREAERAATDVSRRAAAAAAHVKLAAERAADQLVAGNLARYGTGDGGIDDASLDQRRLAAQLESAVEAAAQTTALEVAQAARDVRRAQRVTAADVARTTAAADRFLEREVADSAEAQRRIAASVAAEVAARTNARAAGVAIAAREAAAALVSAAGRTTPYRDENEDDSFYSAFEHDVRLPITAIKGFAELIADADPAEQVRMLDRVDSNSDRLLAMVADLVDYARLGSGVVPLHLHTLDLRALARRAVADLASAYRTARVDVAHGEPVWVVGDPSAVVRIISNLVVNALAYSSERSDVRLVCEQVGQVGRLQVVDRGRGIDARDLDSIFTDYQRGRLAEDDQGTGLGLSSVRRLVDLQSGTVTITSLLDVGTTVTVDLPRAPSSRPGRRAPSAS